MGCGKLGKFFCPNCYKTIRFYDPAVYEAIDSVDDLFMLAHYDGVISAAIKEIKYQGVFAINLELAQMIRENFRDKFQFDFLVPVPLAPQRQADRGFNQAEKLAKYLKMAPVLDCLTRTRETKPQFDLNFKERKINVKDAFELKSKSDPSACSGIRICLIDDVATTGSTISECAKVLKHAGAKKVFAICVARGG